MPPIHFERDVAQDARRRRHGELDASCLAPLIASGEAEQDRGRPDRAISAYQQVLAREPANHAVRTNMSICLRALGHTDAALRELDIVLAQAPQSPSALNTRGNILAEQGEKAAAADAYRAALAVDPDFIEARVNLANVLSLLEQYAEAHAAYEQVLQRNPDFAPAHYNLAHLAQRRGDLDLAIAHYRAAVEAEPRDPRARNNLGRCLDDVGEHAAALAAFEEALHLDPDFVDARVNRALSRLRDGDFAAGWRDHEARPQAQPPRSNDQPLPKWDGSSLDGRVILVCAEQGIGDQIQFASCLPDLIDRAGPCIVECDPRLVSLYARSFPTAQVLSEGDESLPSKPDCWIRIGSVPRFFRNRPADFPRHTGFLTADDEKRAAWRARLQAVGTGLKIGISWRGGGEPHIRALKSTPLELWRPLLQFPGAVFINLQYDADDAELEAEGLFSLVHSFPECRPRADLDDFAALLCELDLIVSVSNATVHLAGALGTEAWALLSRPCGWRWMREGTTSPWYPSVRLFRQPVPGDWNSVMGDVARALEARREAEQR